MKLILMKKMKNNTTKESVINEKNSFKFMLFINANFDYEIIDEYGGMRISINTEDRKIEANSGGKTNTYSFDEVFNQ